jgi:hypothetical protein
MEAKKNLNLVYLQRNCPMGTKGGGGQNGYQTIHSYVLSCRQVSFTLPQGTPPREEHKRFQWL